VGKGRREIDGARDNQDESIQKSEVIDFNWNAYFG
jgi:hypothetical protein